MGISLKDLQLAFDMALASSCRKSACKQTHTKQDKQTHTKQDKHVRVQALRSASRRECLESAIPPKPGVLHVSRRECPESAIPPKPGVLHVSIAA